jgi:hypothetical protein
MRKRYDAESGIFTIAHQRKRGNRMLFGWLYGFMHAMGPPPNCFFDFGAGMGQYVEALNAFGYCGTGCDGTKDIGDETGGKVFHHDLREPINCETAAWGLCVEVGEHIPESALPVFLDSLATVSHGLFISWAKLGQGGTGHVSCRSPEWVAEQMSARGFHRDERVTSEAAGLSPRRVRAQTQVFVR